MKFCLALITVNVVVLNLVGVCGVLISVNLFCLVLMQYGLTLLGFNKVLCVLLLGLNVVLLGLVWLSLV